MKHHARVLEYCRVIESLSGQWLTGSTTAYHYLVLQPYCMDGVGPEVTSIKCIYTARSFSGE